MKILFITTTLPHSAVVGGNVLVYQRIRRLAERGHQVGLVVFEDVPGRESARTLQPYLEDFVMVPSPSKSFGMKRFARIMCSPVPRYFWEYRSDEMLRAVGDLVHEKRYDVAIAEFSAMGQYLYHNPYLPAVRKIVSCHFSISTSYLSYERMKAFTKIGLRSQFAIGRTLRYESEMFRSMDRVLTLTSHERYGLLNINPNIRINVIPPGVDTEYFHPDQYVPKEKAIVFTGRYDTLPNLDAVAWFVSAVWPKLKERYPKLTFYIVGPGAESTLEAMAKKDPSIIVTGRVDDVRPYLHRGRVFVCPIRLGSGLHFKNLEAMAAGIPVVSTTVGAEGIPMQTGDNCFIADTPEIMTSCISLLLDDESLRTAIINRASTLAAERFSWNRGIDSLEKVLVDSFEH